MGDNIVLQIIANCFIVVYPGVTVLTQLPTHSFGMLQNQPKHRSLSNPLENQSALG